MISRFIKKYVAIYFYISSRFVCGNIILLVEYLGGTPELQKLPWLGRQISAFSLHLPLLPNKVCFCDGLGGLQNIVICFQRFLMSYRH